MGLMTRREIFCDDDRGDCDEKLNMYILRKTKTPGMYRN